MYISEKSDLVGNLSCRGSSTEESHRSPPRVRTPYELQHDDKDNGPDCPCRINALPGGLCYCKLLDTAGRLSFAVRALMGTGSARSEGGELILETVTVRVRHKSPRGILHQRGASARDVQVSKDRWLGQPHCRSCPSWTASHTRRTCGESGACVL